MTTPSVTRQTHYDAVMSTASISDFTASYESFLLEVRATYATAALVFFEHLITFKYEIDFLSRRKWSAATWIFILNRYLLLANVINQVAPTVPQICSNPRVMSAIAYLVAGEFPALPTNIFTILRTFALLQDHSWRQLAIWILVALVLTSTTLASYMNITSIWVYINDPILGPSCNEIGFSAPLGVVHRLRTVISVISLISALFVLAVVLMKTARQVQHASRLGLKITLSQVLLRDGSIFFFIILLHNVLLFTVDEALLSLPFDYVVAPFFNVLPPILLSRFIINLRQIDSPDINSSANQHPSRFSMPNFHMPTMDDVVGSLGGPLDFGEHRLYDEDDAQEGSTNLNADTDLQDVNVAGSSSAIGFPDIEAFEAAGPSDTSGESIDANVLDIDGI